MRLPVSFLNESKLQVELLQAALASADLAATKRAAHSLKGMSGSIGGERLREKAQVLEIACRDAAPTVESLSPAVMEEVTATNIALAAYLATGKNNE